MWQTLKLWPPSCRWQAIYHRLDALDAERRKGHQMILGVLGCMAERAQQDLLDNHHCDLVAGPDAYLSLPDLVAQAELGHKAMNIELSTTETYRDVVPQRIGLGHKIGGFVSIMRGCNNFCHYCIVPYTRGRERSRDIESILTEVRDLRDKGYKEVTLLGQNVNSYRLENLGNLGSLGSLDFPALLRKVAEEAPTMRIRFTTSHPKANTPVSGIWIVWQPSAASSPTADSLPISSWATTPRRRRITSSP